jgi:hypothetical protein
VFLPYGLLRVHDKDQGFLHVVVSLGVHGEMLNPVVKLTEALPKYRMLHVLSFCSHQPESSVFETCTRNRCRWYSKIGGVVGVRHSSSWLRKMDWMY